MQTEPGERRRAARVVPDAASPLSRVRLRAGRELQVIDISGLGALVHGAARLLPGTNVDVHVTGPHGRTLVRARVIRCSVWALTADEVLYRGALAFQMHVELGAAGDRVAFSAAPMSGLPAGTRYPRSQDVP